MSQNPDLPPPSPLELRLTASTLLKVIAAVGLTVLAVQLAHLGLILFLAILLAVTLTPVVRWIEKRNAPRWLGITAITLVLILSLGVFFAVVLPSIIDQLSTVVQSFPKYREQLLEQLPSGSFLRKSLGKYLNGSGANASEWIEKSLTAGQVVAGALFEFLLLLVLSVYLVVDGPRMFEWLCDFFSPLHRRKIRETGAEVSQVIFAYVAGQVITSFIVFAVTFAALSVLGVPAPMTLAVLAGVFDVLPVLGFVLSAAPAILLALTVSPSTALVVAGYFVAYHAVENYFLVPKIYGSRLRLSTLVVILSLLVADIIAGIPGAIAVLPIVASYPIIERIWLAPWLGHATLERHSAEDERTGTEATKS